MSPLKWVFTDLGMLLMSFILSAWLLGYYLTKVRDVEADADAKYRKKWVEMMYQLVQFGTGDNWVRLTITEKREICEEAAHRFHTDKSEMSAVCYYLYLEKAFSQPKSRNLLISDMLIEAEVHRSQAKPQPEIDYTII
jgi:hypothetical protein